MLCYGFHEVPKGPSSRALLIVFIVTKYIVFFVWATGDPANDAASLGAALVAG